MDVSFLFIIILSHLLFDFVFQNKFILNLRFPKYKPCTPNNLKKRNYLILLRKSLLGNALHSVIHLVGIYIVSALIYLIIGQPIYIPVSQVLIISISHFIIDELKSLLYLRNTNIIKNIWIFWLDQLFHLAVILIIFSLYNNINIIDVLREKLYIYPTAFSLSEKILLVFINIFTATFGVGIFIKILLSHLSSNNTKTDSKNYNWSQNIQVINKDTLEENNDAGAPNGGFTIGLLERTFILLSMLIDYPMMIGFVLTVKSIARFKKLSNDSFAEYFIIGTFLSFIPAILCGVIIRSLFS